MLIQTVLNSWLEEEQCLGLLLNTSAGRMELRRTRSTWELWDIGYKRKEVVKVISFIVRQQITPINY